MDWAFVRERGAHAALGAWFVSISAYFIFVVLHAVPFGTDGRLYTLATQAFLSGGDPWTVYVTDSLGNPSHYAGLPPTLLVFLPFSPIDPVVSGWVWVVISALAAIWIVRALKLPIYWLAFPPLAEGVFAGNPHVLCMALVLAGPRWLAPVLKVYFFGPLLGDRRWLAIVVGSIVFILSIAVFSHQWSQYLSTSVQVSSRLVEEAPTESAWGTVLFIPTAVALGAMSYLDWRAAMWLAVPALWPGTQLFYSTLAMPFIPMWLGALWAIPVPLMPAACTLIYVGWRIWHSDRSTVRG